MPEYRHAGLHVAGAAFAEPVRCAIRHLQPGRRAIRVADGNTPVFSEDDERAAGEILSSSPMEIEGQAVPG